MVSSTASRALTLAPAAASIIIVTYRNIFINHLFYAAKLAKEHFTATKVPLIILKEYLESNFYASQVLHI